MKYSKKQLREKQKTQAQLSRLVQDSQGLARPAAPPQEQVPARPPKQRCKAEKSRLCKGARQRRTGWSKNAEKGRPGKGKGQKTTKKAPKQIKGQTAALQDYRDMPAAKRKKRKRNAILYIMIVLLLVGIAVISSVTIFLTLSILK